MGFWLYRVRTEGDWTSRESGTDRIAKDLQPQDANQDQHDDAAGAAIGRDEKADDREQPENPKEHD